jgi:hypothetical protein
MRAKTYIAQGANTVGTYLNFIAIDIHIHKYIHIYIYTYINKYEYIFKFM